MFLNFSFFLLGHVFVLFCFGLLGFSFSSVLIIFHACLLASFGIMLSKRSHKQSRTKIERFVNSREREMFVANFNGREVLIEHRVH